MARAVAQLAEWQARMSADNALKQRAAQAARAARERAEAFRELRAALRQLESNAAAPPAAPSKPDAALLALRDDQLAVAVHEAPKRIRTVIAATLQMLSGAPRRGRPPGRRAAAN